MTDKELRPPDSPENPHAGQGFVLLDIGGDIGALVVTMPAAMVGLEIEIRPVGHVASDMADHAHDGHGHGHGHLPHVAVVRRPVPQGGEVPSLVFPELVEGRYELLDKGSEMVRATVEIRGGEVATLDWPA